MEDDFFNLEQTKKIIQQAERWDLYAKITPPFFLALATLLIVFNIIDFDAIFYIGLIMFGLTGVVWWFWSIFTIRYIIKNMSNATNGLRAVRDELKSITTEVKDLRDE